MRNHEILYLFAGEGFLSFPCLTLCITNTGERQTSPRYFNLLKSLAEFAACGGKESQKKFSAGACTWRKIPLRPQVCELCATAHKACAQETAKNLSKSPTGDF